MIASEENAAAYANTIIHQLWAHDCMGFMWWCGFEQSHLTHTPYAWDEVERELGLQAGEDVTVIFTAQVLPISRGILSTLICDAGMTEFHGQPTYTCLALEPLESDVANELTGELPLY